LVISRTRLRGGRYYFFHRNVYHALTVECQKHASAFPTIARMARDYLAIPATSVSVERTFSKSRHICSDLRSSLKAETISEALLTKVWIRCGLFDVTEPPAKRRKHGTVE
jgi:hypothetical protein